MREFERVEVADRAAWRAWLAENHASSPGIWLVFYKKASGKRGLVYDEAVEEALCFGWIDSLVNKLDDERSIQLFTPRKPKSVWSKLNKSRIERLIAAGRMTPAGLAKIDAAKADGSWSTLDSIERLEMPADLESALAANPTARDHFTTFSNSVKKAIYYFIQSAKRPETRAKRVADTVDKAARNLRINFDRE
ncbi:MAG: YdeI/OmpD-associated family protein [Anaerolineae bacterium]|nr:YdeI/OmpD-associated family protein [Anaerolineae bacterium]